jgi:hypothetical protein
VTLALEIITLVLGAVAMLFVLPTGPRVSLARRRRRTPPQRPTDLARLERLVMLRSTASEVHRRIRPPLREIAIARLGSRGVRLDRNPGEAQKLLGQPLWELVRPDRPPPEDPRGPGMTLEELEGLVARLEAL